MLHISPIYFKYCRNRSTCVGLDTTAKWTGDCFSDTLCTVA